MSGFHFGERLATACAITDARSSFNCLTRDDSKTSPESKTGIPCHSGLRRESTTSMDLQHERCQLLTSTRLLSCSLGPRNALPPRRWTESSFIPPTAICLLNSSVSPLITERIVTEELWRI